MPYEITITVAAEAQLRELPVREQRIIEDGVFERLEHQPKALSRAIKRLRPNPLADFELRLGQLRVLYNVDDDKSEVVVLVVGRKQGNKLIVSGEEFHEHEGDTSS